MLNMKTSQSRSRGTSKFSHLTLKSKQDSNISPVKTRQTSKYFAKVTNEELKEDISSSSSDSPYKNCLNEIKNNNLDTSDVDDFKTPNAINKVSKIQKNVNLKQPRRSLKKRLRQPKLRRFVEKFHGKNCDVNPEHLQMAIALSESSYEAENPGLSITHKDTVENFKNALEQYGFKCRGKLQVQNKQSSDDPLKRLAKKSRYRYITPILNLRSSEERESLIASKVSIVLAQNSKIPPTSENLPTEPSLFSESLKKIHSHCTFFSFNNMNLDSLNEDGRFYTKCLNISPSKHVPGRLLKNWHQIPGREPSPTRQTSLNVDSNYSIQVLEDLHLNSKKSESKYESNDNNFSNSGIIINKSSQHIEPENIQSTSKCNLSLEKILYLNPMSPINIIDRNSSPKSVLSHELDTSQISSKLSNDVNPDIASSLNTEIAVNGLSQNGCLNSLSPSHYFDNENFGLNIISSSEVSENISIKYSRSISPDLFDSDDDNYSTEISNKAPTNNLINTESKIVECYDLTNSFDEETADQQAAEETGPQLDKCEDLEISGIGTLIELPENGEDLEISKIETKESDISSNKSGLDTTLELNVTDYLKQVLKRKSTHKNSMETFEKMNMWKFSDETEGDAKDEEKLSQASSQESIVISDDELNYSSNYNTPQNLKNRDNYYKNKNKYDLSDVEEMEDGDVRINQENHEDNCSLRMSPINENEAVLTDFNNQKSLEDCFNDVLCNTFVLNQLTTTNNTPGSSNNLYIKTHNVTPMQDYDAMDTPKIVKELDKFGVKALKRRKGVKVLKHIYETTHPLVGPQELSSNSDEDQEKIVKKRKTEQKAVTNIPVQEQIAIDKDLIFERTQSKRIASCRIPLDIVWHNFVTSNPEIQENILLYEPLQLEVLHSMLKEQGFKFNIQDLLTFLDRKCITIRTCQSNHQKKRANKSQN